ncbi:hypothetical protein Tco_0706354 [Tanacetum coccineum]|uniref:Uncharacterized protein n=1 Tax=Tanacetum coccineum TaxID=301880 RepID=A0ABQ4Y747_9ASTR
MNQEDILSVAFTFFYYSIDTKSNGEYLRKCIFEGPYTPTNVLIAAVEAAENILPVAAHEEAETIHNMTTENKLYFQAEKEANFSDVDWHQNLKDRMHHQTCNLLPHDQVRLPDTKAKRIAKPITPQSSVYEEDSDPEQARGIRI